MKFKYSLQKVLDLKTNEKKQAETALSEAVSAQARIERELSELMLRKHETQRNMTEQLGAKRTIAETIEAQRFVDYLEDCIRNAKSQLEASERLVAEQREQLTARTVDEKVWLKSREKAYLLFRSEAERRTQNELDEIATTRSRFA